MPSLWKDDRSPYWVACFTGYLGTRRLRFKKTTGIQHIRPPSVESWSSKDAERQAMKIAEQYERVAQGAMDAAAARAFLKGIDDLRVRRVCQRTMDQILKRTSGTGLAEKTPRNFFTSYLEQNRGTIAAGSFERYRQAADLFLASLGPVADEDFSCVTDSDVVRFRNAQSARVAPSTANNLLKIIRMFCEAAQDAGILTRNPCRGVKPVKAGGGRTRREFTLQELAKLLENADDEWRSMILFGFYTGMRLGDIASLRWSQLDTAAGELTYTSRKTGRTTIVPLPAALLSHLAGMTATDDPASYLHPKAAARMAATGDKANRLSNEFFDLMALAGLVERRSHRAKENRANGRQMRREMSPISFHSLRHTCTSILKRAGVPAAVVMDIIGHNSAAMSAHYTHIDSGTKREAVSNLPDLVAWQGAASGKDAAS
jgi:integrase